MLTRELMGWLALGILWINTLLVVGAAFAPMRELLGRLALARRHGVWRGRAIRDANSDDVVAWHAVDQVGRKAADDHGRRAILFHDRGFASGMAGGRIEVDGVELSLPALDDDSCEVWVERGDQQRVGACPSAERFDDALRAASKAKGFVRELRTELSDGAELWVVAAKSGAELCKPEEGKLLVASFDPRPWLRRRVALAFGFQLAMIAIAAVVSWLVLTPPIFGTISTIGGVLGLAFFLLILQPGGVALRDAIRLPSLAFVRGSWVLLSAA
jgi:hypothetical protein